MTPASDPDVHRAYLALLVAVLDGHCDTRAHDLLCDQDDPHYAVRVAHHAAHQLVASVDQADHPAMRQDLAAELLALAGEG